MRDRFFQHRKTDKIFKLVPDSFSMDSVTMKITAKFTGFIPRNDRKTTRPCTTLKEITGDIVNARIKEMF